MPTRAFHRPRTWALAAALLACPATAQSPPLPVDATGQPLLKHEHWLAGLVAPANPTAPGATARFRLYRMMPGFLNDPLGLDSSTDENAHRDDPAAACCARGPLDGASPDWVQVAFGQDNPWFDLRRPGDPGGVGYLRIHSQMRLADWGSTSVCLGLQALMPAGPEDGGLKNGATVLQPGLAVFQDLGNGLALQGFVGHNLRSATTTEPNEQQLQWGMGVQCPLLGGERPGDQGLYLFVQALAAYTIDGNRANGRTPNWEFVPGVHWRVSNNCWMSLGASRTSLLTCSWQF